MAHKDNRQIRIDNKRKTKLHNNRHTVDKRKRTDRDNKNDQVLMTRITKRGRYIHYLPRRPATLVMTCVNGLRQENNRGIRNVPLPRLRRQSRRRLTLTGQCNLSRYILASALQLYWIQRSRHFLVASGLWKYGCRQRLLWNDQMVKSVYL